MRQTHLRIAVAALAALLCLALTTRTVFAQNLQPKADPTEADIEQAKQHMAAGVAFIRDPDKPRYEEAYPEFKKAYELSGSLNALHNLAISAMHLELDGEAIEYYGRVLEQKGEEMEESEKAQLEQDLNRLRSTVAWVALSADDPGVTVTDVRTPRRGAPVRNQYDIGLQQKKFGVHPGSHTFTATNEEGVSKTWKVEITNGAKLNHEFVFDPNAPVTADGFTSEDGAGFGGSDPIESPDEDASEGGTPAYVWAMTGVTIAAGVTWGALMGVSASKKSEYDSEILGQAPIDEQQSAADELTTINLVADVMLGVTVASAATTLILALTAPDGEEEEDETAKNEAPRFGVDYTVAPMVNPNGTSVGAALTTHF